MDSKLCDAQAGYESLLTSLLPSLAGANLLYGTGMVDSGMTLDYGKMLLDDEINLAIKRVIGGMQVNEETLSVELIKEIGHSGNFLTHPSTYEQFGNLIQPQLINRDNYEQWTEKGQRDIHDMAMEKARSIVENHRPTPISQQAQQEIDDIIRETEKELGIEQ